VHVAESGNWRLITLLPAVWDSCSAAAAIGLSFSGRLVTDVFWAFALGDRHGCKEMSKMEADHVQLSFLPNRREDVFVKSVWVDVLSIAGGDFRSE